MKSWLSIMTLSEMSLTCNTLEMFVQNVLYETEWHFIEYMSRYFSIKLDRSIYVFLYFKWNLIKKVWLLHSTCCVFLLGWNVLLNEHCLHRHCLKKCMDITLSETLLNLTTLDILFISKRCLSITASNGRLSNGNGYLF